MSNLYTSLSALQNTLFFLTEAPVEESVKLFKTPGFIVGPIAEALGKICDFFFNIVSNIFASGTLGITIILFTIVVRIIMVPLAAYSAKSMAKMRVIQPELKKIQAKYKGKTDVESRQKMNAEVSELQRKNGANPFKGCLPLIIQMPILYALFFILQRAYLYIGKMGQLYTDISEVMLQIPDIGPTLYPIVTSITSLKHFVAKGGGFDLAYADNCREVISKIGTHDWVVVLAGAPQDLVNQLTPLLAEKANIEIFLGINLVENPALLALSVFIPILSGGTTFLSTWLMNKAQGPAADDQARLQQRMMLFAMPGIMGVMCFSLPAGLGLYWIMGNIFQIGQQYVFNKIYDPNKSLKEG